MTWFVKMPAVIQHVECGASASAFLMNSGDFLHHKPVDHTLISKGLDHLKMPFPMVESRGMGSATYYLGDLG